MIGSGPFQGRLSQNEINFTIPGKTNDAEIDLVFSGKVYGGDLIGMYVVPSTGEEGTWLLSRPTPNSTPTPVPSPTHDATIYYRRGVKLAGDFLYDSAVDQFTLAIRANPNFVEAYVSRGTIYSLLGEVQ